MNKKTDIPSLSSNDKDRIIALIKDNSENCNLESNTNRGKGIANRRYVIKYQDVIKRCYEEGITIRNIYKGLMRKLTLKRHKPKLEISVIII